MAKYAGLIGYAIQGETEPGVYEDQITERFMRGDIITSRAQYQQSDNKNDDLTLGNRFSLVGDPFAYHNFKDMKFVTYLGYRWKVTSVTIEKPRLVVEVGGVYNR